MRQLLSPRPQSGHALAMRLLCPATDVDWAQKGGLMCCNWPIKDSPEGGPNGMKLVAQSDSSVTIEIEKTPAVIPCFVMTMMFIVPCMPVLMALDPSVQMEAWVFDQNLQGRVGMHRRIKTPFSEAIVQMSDDVLLACVESVEDYDPVNEVLVAKKRLTVCAATGQFFNSPWKPEASSNLESVAMLINGLISQEARSRAQFPPPPVPPVQALEMNRESIPTLADASLSQAPGARAGKAYYDLAALDAGPVAAPVQVDYVTEAKWGDIPLSKLLDRIKVELGMDSDSGETVAQAVRRMCLQVAVSESGVLKTDAARVAAQLGLTPADLVASR